MFSMAPKYSAEVLASVPKCKKAVMYLMEKPMSQIIFVQAWVTGLLAMSSVLVNLTICDTVCLHIETHMKQGYVLIGFCKCQEQS